MFSGLPGLGKTTISRIFAKAILCEKPQEGDPCGECESCKLFEHEQHFGYMELDSASVGGKEDMIKLRDEAAFLSVVKKKIILLDECHDISKQGQDALLEQVEKCPEHLVYIFCTTAPDKMQKPLRDRCMHFQFPKVDCDLIYNRLKYICEQEKITFDEEALKLISIRSEGHVRNAINLLEEVIYLGHVTVKNINIISRDYDEEIFTIISNLGIDLPKVMEAAHKISSSLSAIEFYNQLLAMVSDASKAMFGYENLPEKRKNLISRLKDIHGHSLIEFLNYLVTRDKFIEKTGIQSDLVILHYKFNSNNFIPKFQQQQAQNVVPTYTSEVKTQEIPQTKEPTKDAPPLTYSDLRKMNPLEQSRLLRMRRNQKLEQKEDSEKVPVTWPLPKEEKTGESSMDEVQLSPQEFSQKLVGGRSGGSKLANSRAL
jgi:DNA polymerase III subunit gamma/tau